LFNAATLNQACNGVSSDSDKAKKATRGFIPLSLFSGEVTGNFGCLLSLNLQQDGFMVDWFVITLRSYPEFEIFLSLALGPDFRSFAYQGPGAVTATLIAAVIIGQLGITTSPPIKVTMFLTFLLAIGYGWDVVDRPSDIADVAFIGAAIAIGALVGAFVYKVGDVPLTLSTSGGALISGLFFRWVRAVHPPFGRIPSSKVWFMNSVGLNVFIGAVGISWGRGFVAGLRELGFRLFLWVLLLRPCPWSWR
jgi:Predicted Permease Membrane Region